MCVWTIFYGFTAKFWVALNDSRQIQGSAGQHKLLFTGQSRSQRKEIVSSPPKWAGMGRPTNQAFRLEAQSIL